VKVSIVIPTLNGGQQLMKSCLALLTQDFPYSWELILIDSQSQDTTNKKIAMLFKKSEKHCHVINIKKHSFNHGSTRNKAISSANGDIICLITQDAIPRDKSWLYELTKPLLMDANVSASFGRHVIHKNHPKILSKYLDHHFDFMNSKKVRKIDNKIKYENDIHLRQFLHFFSNNNSAIRKSVWMKNPFPKVNFGEDQIWAKKILELDGVIVYCDKAVVMHSHNYSLQDTFRRSKTEKEYYYKYFGYNLSISKLNFISTTTKLIVSDLCWLYKSKHLNLREILCTLIVNIGTQAARVAL